MLVVSDAVSQELVDEIVAEDGFVAGGHQPLAAVGAMRGRSFTATQRDRTI